MGVEPEDDQDGRRRSAASKLKIVEAMPDIVRTGETSPSADQVAERAGVGRRAVFRLFNDMDSIYSQMNATMRQRLERWLDRRQDRVAFSPPSR